jgi:hypothetical protein
MQFKEQIKASKRKQKDTSGNIFPGVQTKDFSSFPYPYILK